MTTYDTQAPSIDLERAEAAVTDLLAALGVESSAPGLTATPGRVARMYGELLTPPTFEATTFPNNENYDQLIVVNQAFAWIALAARR